MLLVALNPHPHILPSLPQSNHDRLLLARPYPDRNTLPLSADSGLARFPTPSLLPSETASQSTSAPSKARSSSSSTSLLHGTQLSSLSQKEPEGLTSLSCSQRVRCYPSALAWRSSPMRRAFSDTISSSSSSSSLFPNLAGRLLSTRCSRSCTPSTTTRASRSLVSRPTSSRPRSREPTMRLRLSARVSCGFSLFVLLVLAQGSRQHAANAGQTLLPKDLLSKDPPQC